MSFASLPGGYTVPADAHDGDGLNYLAGHDFNEIAAIARGVEIVDGKWSRRHCALVDFVAVLPD